MNEQKPAMVSHFEVPHVSFKSYIYGFVSCLALTILAYFVATSGRFNDRGAIIIVSILAAIQCTVQLRRFLHVGHEFKPRQKLMMFGVMITIVVIILIGSLWIMDNLNYRMMGSPKQTQQYIDSQDGL